MTDPRAPLKPLLRDELDERDVQRLWRGVQHRRDRAAERRRQRPVRVLAAVALIASLIPLALLWRHTPSASQPTDGILLVENGSAPDRLSAPAGGAELNLRLVDGSSITLKPGTEVEVLENSGTSFITALRRGKSRFEVKPGGPRRWTVECGTVTVEVVGTGFTVERTASRVAVEVHHGIVLVRGEAVPDRVRRLTAGERLDLTTEAPALVPPKPGTPTAAPAAPVSPIVLPKVVPAHVVPKVTPSAPVIPVETDEWRVSAQKGDFAAAHQLLGADRLRREIRQANELETLLLLADVARANGDPALAAEALHRGLREQPDDLHAGVAAFTLGMLELENLHHPEQAAMAFERVISLGRPQALQEDAQARLVEALSRSGNPEAARAAAETYLQRYPSGRRAPEVRRWMEP